MTSRQAEEGQGNHEAATRHPIHAAHDHSGRAGTRRLGAGDVPAEWAGDAPAAGAADDAPVRDGAGSPGRFEGSDPVADLLGRVQRAAAQPLDAADTAKRSPAGAAVDFSDRHPRLSRPGNRNDAARDRRRDVRHRQQQSGVGARRANRRADLAVPSNAAGELLGLRLLRTGEPRLRSSGRPPVHGHAGRPSGGARPQNGLRDLGRRGRRSHESQRDYARASRCQREGDCGSRRRRLLEPRLHRRVRRADGQASLAVLHGPSAE